MSGVFLTWPRDLLKNFDERGPPLGGNAAVFRNRASTSLALWKQSLMNASGSRRETECGEWMR